MADKEPDAAPRIRGFYIAYWKRIRTNVWGQAHKAAVPVLLGRFCHEVTVCKDGVVVVLHRASADSFEWKETAGASMEVLKGVLRTAEAWRILEMEHFKLGSPSELDFDLDVATRREDDPSQHFDRLQLRYVPFDQDRGFWTPPNAERLAGRNLAGPIE